MYLFDLVAGAGDSLRDALVGADGRGQLGVVLDDLLIQVPVTLLKRLLQAPLLRLPVLHVIAVGQGPGGRRTDKKATALMTGSRGGNESMDVQLAELKTVYPIVKKLQEHF